MYEWNIGHDQHGMTVRNVHFLHVGHAHDSYCYPCEMDSPPATRCKGANYPTTALCPAESEGYQGYRALIGIMNGRAGCVTSATSENILVSGPYLRAFSIASAWSQFGPGPVGCVSGWVSTNIPLK